MKTETLKQLQDYFATTDNVWVQSKLEMLELEIDGVFIKGKIEASDEMRKIWIRDE